MEQITERRLLYYCSFQSTSRNYNGEPIFHFTYKDVKTGEEVILGSCLFNQEVSDILGGHYYSEITDAADDFDILWSVSDEKISPIDDNFETVQAEYQRMLNEGISQEKINSDMMILFQSKMEGKINNVYFKGLEQALNDGCYIKVFICAERYPVVRVEKKDKETGEEKLVSYAEMGNVLSVLNNASNKIIDEVSEISDDKIWCERLLLDKVVDRGYTLHFFKLADGQVLSTICTGGYGNYIPIKTVMAADIKTSFGTLNATLKTFDFESSHDFHDFAESQTAPILEYRKQKKLQKKKQNDE